jgi:hypothetical protein
MKIRRSAALLLAPLLLSCPTDVRASGDLTFFSGYAAFVFHPTTPGVEGPPQEVAMEAHARASDVGSPSPGGLVVRVEFPRPFLAATTEAAYVTLVLGLPRDVLDLAGGTLYAADGLFDTLYYETPAQGGAKLFLAESAEGEVTWAHAVHATGGGDLRLTAWLRLEDPGPDSEAGTADDGLRELSRIEIHLFRSVEPVPLPGQAGIYDPGEEIYLAGDVVVYYDDGCSDDPTVTDWDDYDDGAGSTAWGEDDTGCDGDTWDDDDWDSESDSSCDDDWDTGDDDSGGWDGDRWALTPREVPGRIRGMGLTGLLARAVAAHRRPLRVLAPLVLGLGLLVALKRRRIAG